MGATKLRYPGLECWRVDSGVLYMRCGVGLDLSLTVLVGAGPGGGFDHYISCQFLQILVPYGFPIQNQE